MSGTCYLMSGVLAERHMFWLQILALLMAGCDWVQDSALVKWG